MMDFNMLGKRIRDERLLLRLTLEQLAEKVDKSTNFIGQIERGDRKLSIETLVDIANALGTTVDSLLIDNIKSISDDSLIREISTLLYSTDETGKRFIADIVKSYAIHHRQKK